MSDWGNPLKPKKGKDTKKVVETELPLFKREKLSLSKSEAKKVLNMSVDLGFHQIEWVQRWLEQRVRERCLPPQLSGANAFASIALFLSPPDVISLLDDIRRDFRATLPTSVKDEFPISVLEASDFSKFVPEP